MKRKPDDAESRESPEPLFAFASDKSIFVLSGDPASPEAELVAAETRAVVGMTRAIDKAERVEPRWRTNALEAVRLFARTHDVFLTEDVRRVFPTPENADARAWGAVMRDAVNAHFVAHDGFAPAASSNGSAKVRWRSLIR